MSSGDAPESHREAAARLRSESRLRRQRSLLRPVGWALIATVAATVAAGDPPPGVHGRSAAVGAALAIYLIGVAVLMDERFAGRGVPAQLALTVLIGVAGLVLMALAPRGASALAPSAAVWIAIARLPLRLGIGLAAMLTVAIGLVAGFSGSSSGAVLASALLCALLGLMAHFMKQSRESQDHTEMLLAELQDARDGLADAAAGQERTRIAGELHDVLAHSLSGAAIQLQGARLLAERQGAQAQVCTAIDRAAELVKAGLDDARRAVSALRGERQPTVEELGRLIERFREDMAIDATLRIEGDARAVAPDASLALYRGAQEALTNVARHAPGAATTVILRYAPGCTLLTVEDRRSGGAPPAPHGLRGVGGGHGLEGMRARVERLGGRLDAGPTATGWRVELEVPS